jgi:hypothetical protein
LTGIELFPQTEFFPVFRVVDPAAGGRLLGRVGDGAILVISNLCDSARGGLSSIGGQDIRVRRKKLHASFEQCVSGGVSLRACHGD